MPMKTAKKTVFAVEIECPECQADVESPSGSLFWTVVELDLQHEKGRVWCCAECHELFRLPVVK